MRSFKTKKWIGILLATLLLLQLSYHTLHVFSAHVSDSHIENTSLDSQIDEITFTCELCAKLLGQTAYLWTYLTILLGFVAPLLILDTGEQFIRPGTQVSCLLRGPPITLL